MALFDDNPAITTLDRVAIEKFCTFYYDSRKKIEAKKFTEARSSYVELLSLYEEMKKANLGQIHLEVASHCIQEVYNDLSQELKPALSGHSFRMMFAVTLIVLLLGVGLIVTPRLSGLAVFSNAKAPVYTGPAEFYISGLTVLNLEEYFFSEGNMAYLVTEDPLLDVTLENSKVYIMPRAKGTASITLMAFNTDVNPPLVTKVPVIVRS